MEFLRPNTFDILCMMNQNQCSAKKYTPSTKKELSDGCFDIRKIKNETEIDDMKHVSGIWNQLKVLDGTGLASINRKRFNTLDLCTYKDVVQIDDKSYIRIERVYEHEPSKKLDMNELTLFIIYMHFFGLVHFGFEPLIIKYGITNSNRSPKYHIMTYNFRRINLRSFYEMKHILHIFAYDIKANIHNDYEKYSDLARVIDSSYNNVTNICGLANNIVKIAKDPSMNSSFVPLLIPYNHLYKHIPTMVKTCIVYGFFSEVVDDIQYSLNREVYPVCIKIPLFDKDNITNKISDFSNNGMIHKDIQIDFCKNFDVLFLILDTFINVMKYDENKLVHLIHECKQLSNIIVICSTIRSCKNSINIKNNYPLNIVYHNPINNNNNYQYYCTLVQHNEFG